MRCYAACLWLLSGLPVAIALMLLPPEGLFAAMALFIVLETAHSLSPIVLAWTHGEFRRQVIYARPRQFLLWPSLLFGGATAVGVATQMGWTSYVPGLHHYMFLTAWDNPFPILVWAYSAWNLYHFAMQDYGVLILVSGPTWRWCKRIGCFLVFLGGYWSITGINVLGLYQVPSLVGDWWVWPFVMMGMVSVNHWIVDIGLSTRVAGWWFPLVVLAAGSIGFLWLIPTSGAMLVRMIPALVCARMGLGFVHFLYSKYVWQLSDPRVRGTIGRDLFAGA